MRGGRTERKRGLVREGRRRNYILIFYLFFFFCFPPCTRPVSASTPPLYIIHSFTNACGRRGGSTTNKNVCTCKCCFLQTSRAHFLQRKRGRLSGRCLLPLQLISLQRSSYPLHPYLLPLGLPHLGFLLAVCVCWRLPGEQSLQDKSKRQLRQHVVIRAS